MSRSIFLRGIGLVSVVIMSLSLVGCPMQWCGVCSDGLAGVPDVVGKLETAADTVLAAAGLAMGTATRQYSETVGAGCVISQEPAGGTRAAPGTAVDLVCSRGPDPCWERTFGGQGLDYGYGVRETDDGGFIVAGATTSFGAGGSDAYLVKTDSRGFAEWSQTYGGTSSDEASAVLTTGDGGYIFVGETRSFGGAVDAYLVKTDGAGNEVWSNDLGGQWYEYGFSLSPTSDGGYIICGDTNSYGAADRDLYLAKADASGTEQWHALFGGAGGESGSDAVQTSDGGYVAVGLTSSYGSGSHDVYFVKTDSSGVEQWSSVFGGSGSDWASAVKQTSDGGYIVAGRTASSGAGAYDVYLIKTDSSGNEEWSSTLGGNRDDSGSDVEITSDGGYIIAGYTRSSGGGGFDVYLVKTDSSGNEEWSSAFGGADDEFGSCVQQTSDGGYVIAAETRSFGAGMTDMYLIKTDSQGNHQWSGTP